MSDDKKTDPYNGELPDDADLGSSNDDDDALDDAAKALTPDERGLRSEGEAPLP